MRKTIDYIKDEKIQFLKEILRNFDNFEIGKKYVFKYNSHIRDFEYELHKPNEKMIFLYIFYNKIEINKNNENKFEVIINLDNYMRNATMKRVVKFLTTDSKYYYNHLVWYHKGVWHLVLDGLIIPIRTYPRILKMIIVKRPEKYYLSLPELQKRPLPDSEFGFPIMKGLLYLYEVNGKRVKNLIQYCKKKHYDIPYILRIKMQNRKIEYMIFKMLLKKGIVEPFEKINSKLISGMLFRIHNNEIENHTWDYTNMVIPVVRRMRGGQFPNFAFIALQDYNYDNVNQILLKFIDPYNRTFLCGVDYSNSMWCMRLQGFMFKYKIKSVYKVMYDLTPETKVFEF